MPELISLGYEFDEFGNIIISGTPAVGENNGGDLTIAGGAVEDGLGGEVTIQGGSATNTGAGGLAVISGGHSIDFDGGGVGVTGGNSETADGGNVEILAGSSTTGGDGGDVIIKPGVSIDETGAYGDVVINVNIGALIGGNIILTGLKTANPVVAGALWNDSGTLKISAG